ncbi:hypothetical protein PITCH_A840032 [uncultured Desulfobacterium sp.]|uniref:Flagellar Assembly Protein A N-terminal region domain-containing protein n=1 Tax=uncultured Desulfobacterium sp. TaxID=201089 RepID=A0A445N389_9BACT|nr:hypothetical protein PITCH_A840032 [uncultured Desulfobacterium sp.]
MINLSVLERKFGLMVIQKGFTTKDQLTKAFDEQKLRAEQGKSFFVADILVEAKAITEEQKKAILATQRELKEFMEAQEKGSGALSSEEQKKSTLSTQGKPVVASQAQKKPPDPEEKVFQKKIILSTQRESVATPQKQKPATESEEKVFQQKTVLSTKSELKKPSDIQKKDHQPDKQIGPEGYELIEEDIDEGTPDVDGAKSVQNGSGFELAVTQDRMKAYIYPIDDNPSGVSLDSIKGLIAMEGLKIGIVKDDIINQYLMSKPNKGSLCKVARGIPVDLGRQTEIRCHFETNPFKVATIHDDGSIDFKNRGEIPWSKAQDLLAELIPGTDGKQGKDVYGYPIDPPPPDMVSLSCGKGVKKSEDGLKFFAEADGRPELSPNGTISVTETLPISGDIGIETGHIIFPGHVQVKGSVQDGYRVKAKTLRADEINNAEIETEGEIIVNKGIIGAKIYTDGPVRARHIRNTSIDALGDVIIEREVYESHIETNGTLNIDRGTVMDSRISAMKGITAAEIGSTASNPCTLIIGIDNRLEKQITVKNLNISEKEKEREAKSKLLDELKDKPDMLETRIGELAQEQDNVTVKQRSLKETLKSLQKANDRINIIKVLTIMKAINVKLEKMQKDIDDLLKEQEQTEATIAGYNDEIAKLTKEISELQDDIKSMLELSKIRNVSSWVKVTENIYDRTSIRGRNASLVVKGTLTRVVIQETKNPTEGAEPSWLMSVSNL